MVRLVFRPYTQIWRSICTSDPPEFPLASPYSGIVHHLSGPSIYAHTHAEIVIIWRGRWCIQRNPTFSLSLRIRVCHPNTRIHVRLLGPCFKTGRLKPFRQHPKPKLQTSVQFKAWLKAITPEGYLPLALYFESNWCWLVNRKGHCNKSQLNSCKQYWFQTFPFW
jgi:hypothetical protein